MMSPQQTFSTALTLLLLLSIPACTHSGSATTPSLIPPTEIIAPPTATSEPMAALVNGEGIPVQEFQAEVERYRAAQEALGRTVSLEQASQTVLDDLVNQTLLAQAAYAAGFKVDDSALQQRIESLAAKIGGPEKLAEWQSAHGYTPETFKTALKRALAAAWMRDQIAASVPAQAEQVHVQQILTYTEEKAVGVKSQLDAGGDFAKLAALYDPVTHGDLGWFPRGYLFEPEIEKAAFSLQPGQISDVISTPAGFHILKVLERDPNRPLSPDARLTLQDLALRAWIEDRRRQSTIILAP